MVKAAEFQGTCAVCQGTFKVRDGKMVLHGYQRPGDGYIDGRCWGEGAVPWELSPEAAESFLHTILRPNLARLDASLAQYVGGAVTSITRPKGRSHEERRRGDAPVILTFTPESPEWAREFERAKSAVESEHRYYARMVQDFEARIAAWTLGTLVPVVVEAKHLTVAFERGSWVARSMKSGRVIEHGRLLADVLSRAKLIGWSLPPGVVLPAEHNTSDLYRALAETPEAPETVAQVGRNYDPVVARVVVAAYEGLPSGQRATFDRLALSAIWKAVRTLNCPPSLMQPEALRVLLAAELG